MKPWLEHSDISTDEIVRLYRDEKISVKAVAKRLDINPKTVLSRLSKAGVGLYLGNNQTEEDHPMKTRIVAVAALFMSFVSFVPFASTQISISPLAVQFAKKASDQITITNDGLVPVVATLSAQTLGLTPDGHAAILPLSKEVIVKLHDLSGRIDPNTSRTFDYDIKCPRCVTMIVATITPIEKRAKDIDDGEVHTGVRIRQAMATVVYVCPKLKENGGTCRDSFAALWRDAK